jgi:signal peptidase I
MLNFIRYLLASLLFIMAAAAIAWLALWRLEGARLFSVQTGSMAPAINKGDLVLDVQTPPKQLKAGYIISYASPARPGEIVTHRIAKAEIANGYLVTKGDNLDQTDPPVPLAAVLGRTVKVVPKAGMVFDKISRPWGLVGLIYLPAATIVLIELGRLSRQFKARPYQLI